MAIPNYQGEHFPAGRKLTTYEPSIPGNFDTGVGGDDYLGFLISRGGSKNRVLATDELGPIYPRLVIVVAAQDSQEQSSHRALYSMAELLIRPKTPAQADLAAKLLNQFDFLMFPFMSQANVRDGRSRYGYDAPPPGVRFEETADGHNEGWLGLSSVGRTALTKAIEDWVSDHPYQQRSVFCLLTLHCDVLNMDVGNAVGPWTLRDEAGNHQTAPYAKLHYPDGPIMRFRQPEGRDGFDAVIHREFFTPGADTIVEGDYHWGLPAVSSYGGTEMYFEAPWNATSHKASHDTIQEDADNFAEAWLTGVAVVSAVEDYYGETHVTADTSVTVQGYHDQLGSTLVETTPVITVQGVKNAVGSTRIQATPSVSVSGYKDGRGGVQVGGGSVSVSGMKEASGSISVVSASAVLVQGTALEVREGSTSVTATPSISVQGRKVGLGQAHVVGSTSLTVSGQKRASGSIAIGAQTSVTVQGSHIDTTPGSGTVRIEAQSSVVTAGFKTASGNVSIRSYSQVRVNSAAPPVEPPPSIKFRLCSVQPSVTIADRKPLVRLMTRQPLMVITRRH